MRELPKVGDVFVWTGGTFRREPGEIKAGLFPVTYVAVEHPSNAELVGKDGLMNVSDVEQFRLVEFCKECGQPLARV